ncbi:aminotransferase-like domain-containing protein [Kribbella deserti]|uniref:PLP-dependent aminotransferase family protein n=1 Tax=Kribbella deserti TaxID=1926257 RepID=A0ABV6QHA5_9ACTN
MWRADDLDPADGTKTAQVEGLVLRRIERGDLSIGSRLPSERVLADRLGVSRVTVVRALDQLRADGVLETRRGSGTHVRPLDRLLDPIAPASTVTTQTGRALVQADEPLLDLRFATTAAPHDVAEACAQLVTGGLPQAMGGDGPPPGGSAELRAVLAAQLTREGVPTEADQLTLTVGAAAGLNAALAGLDLGPGIAITESPTYPAALDILRRHHLEVVGWPAGVWDPDQLAHLCRRHKPKVIYLQADNHNPTGLSLPGDRRLKVVEIARRYDATLICDETLRPLWLSASEQPPPLSRYPRTVSVGSLSKTVWGGLRVGWVRSGRQLRRRMTTTAQLNITSPSALDDLLAQALVDRLDQLVVRRRARLRANLAALETGLRTLPGVAWVTPTGGMTLWLELTELRSRRVLEIARRHGLLLSAGDLFTPDGTDRRHLRIPFTAPPETLRLVVDRLGQALTEAQDTSVHMI